jgi:hypothetical protein
LRFYEQKIVDDNQPKERETARQLLRLPPD